MSRRDLTDKYGKNKKPAQAINAAIRAELAGGNEALEALNQLRTLHDRRGLPETAAGLQHARAIVDAMAAEIRRRYGIFEADEVANFEPDERH